MGTEIEWPLGLLITDEVIEMWFAAAVAKNLVPPGARTIQAQAEALDNAGIIRLAKQTTVVIPQTKEKEDDNEAREIP